MENSHPCQPKLPVPLWKFPENLLFDAARMIKLVLAVSAIPNTAPTRFASRPTHWWLWGRRTPEKMNFSKCVQTLPSLQRTHVMQVRLSIQVSFAAPDFARRELVTAWVALHLGSICVAVESDPAHGEGGEGRRG